jgi:uncharacterized membrane protein
MQSKTYVWLYYCKYGVIPTVDYVVMIKKRKKEKIQHLSFKYQMADILSHDAKVRNILEKIKNREFDKPAKNHPFFCDCQRYRALFEKS